MADTDTERKIDDAIIELRLVVQGLYDLLEDAMVDLCLLNLHGKYAGYYDTCSNSTACRIGDALAQAGFWERHPDGYGRRWFYRPKQKEANDG